MPTGTATSYVDRGYTSATFMCNPTARCWADIDLAALAANVRLLNTVGPKIMAVVKADAYGHDVDIIVPALIGMGVSHFAVATVIEAAELRALPGMETASVYLMAAVLSPEVDDILRLNLIPFVTDTQFVRSLSEAAIKQGKIANIHLEVDTGIGRAGVLPDQLLPTLTYWRTLPGIKVTGISTHFTEADSTDSADSLAQHELFESLLASLPKEFLHGVAIHAANSPATLRVPHQRETLIRPGLLLYGIAPSPDLAVDFKYKPVLTLKARALLVRHLPAGSDISYSRTYRLPHDATIATIGIGYGDGYPRRLSNIGTVQLEDGTVAKIRGRVCMDQLCIEIPEGGTLLPGDTVTLIGKEGENEITVSDIANLIDTTPHEITTALLPRIARFAR
jgi:alanine racemase